MREKKHGESPQQTASLGEKIEMALGLVGAVVGLVIAISRNGDVLEIALGAIIGAVVGKFVGGLITD